jgi:hypothetical protein
LSIWSRQDFPFSGAVGTDVTIGKAYPAIIFNANGDAGIEEYQEIREINGDLWFLNNAAYNTTTLMYSQVNPALPSYGFIMGGNGSSGNVVDYYMPAGSAPWTSWTLFRWAFYGTGVSSANLSMTGSIGATGSISAGTGTLGPLSAGDLGASRSAITGQTVFGSVASGGTLDYGLTITGQFTFSSQVNATTSNTSSGSGVLPPLYKQTGSFVATPVNGVPTDGGGVAHTIYGATFTAPSTAVTTVDFGAAYAFTDFMAIVQDNTANTTFAGTVATTHSFTFTPVSGHVYRWYVVGY